MADRTHGLPIPPGLPRLDPVHRDRMIAAAGRSLKRDEPQDTGETLDAEGLASMQHEVERQYDRMLERKAELEDREGELNRREAEINNLSRQLQEWAVNHRKEREQLDREVRRLQATRRILRFYAQIARPGLLLLVGLLTGVIYVATWKAPVFVQGLSALLAVASLALIFRAVNGWSWLFSREDR